MFGLDGYVDNLCGENICFTLLTESLMNLSVSKLKKTNPANYAGSVVALRQF